MNYASNPPELKEALEDMFVSSEASNYQANEYANEIINKSKYIISNIYNKKIESNPNITKEESIIISSYTCELNKSNFNPYRLLNQNLNVIEKRSLNKIAKYLYILLNALRKLKRYYPKEK